LNSVFPVVFDDIYPKGAFLGGGGVTPVKGPFPSKLG
jgi:hypothetical protein